MAANNDPGMNAGYAAPLQGPDSAVKPLLQNGFTALTRAQVATLTAGSGAQGPSTAADPVSPTNQQQAKPTVATAPVPPRPRE